MLFSGTSNDVSFGDMRNPLQKEVFCYAITKEFILTGVRGASERVFQFIGKESSMFNLCHGDGP